MSTPKKKLVTTVRNFKIVDPDQIPKEYWVIDQMKLAESVQDGESPAGCEIWEEEKPACEHCPCHTRKIMRCCHCKEVPRGTYVRSNGKPHP